VRTKSIKENRTCAGSEVKNIISQRENFNVKRNFLRTVSCIEFHNQNQRNMVEFEKVRGSESYSQAGRGHQIKKEKCFLLYTEGSSTGIRTQLMFGYN